MPHITPEVPLAVRLLASADGLDALLVPGDHGDDLFDTGLLMEDPRSVSGYSITPAGETLINEVAEAASGAWQDALLLLDPQRATDEQWGALIDRGLTSPCPDDPDEHALNERGAALITALLAAA